MLTISYGVGNSRNRDESSYRNVGEVLRDSSIQAGLGFDPNEVDARVNGGIVGLDTPVYSGMSIDLIKKAGKKSVDSLTLEQQLRPIGISAEVLATIGQKAKDALQPLYKAMEALETTVYPAMRAEQAATVAGTPGFIKFQEGLLKKLVDENYVDGVGSLSVPAAVREELAKIQEKHVAPIKALQLKIRDAEVSAEKWRRSVIADVGMTVTIADQRKLVAKAMASDPLAAWAFEA